MLEGVSLLLQICVCNFIYFRSGVNDVTVLVVNGKRVVLYSKDLLWFDFYSDDLVLLMAL